MQIIRLDARDVLVYRAATSSGVLWASKAGLEATFALWRSCDGTCDQVPAQYYAPWERPENKLECTSKLDRSLRASSEATTLGKDFQALLHLTFRE